MDFYDLPLCDDVLDALDSMRFETATPIQEKAIPPLLEGNDLIGVAQTGTGKTAAYLLPLLNNLTEGNYPSDAINCIIMAPTRELAQQIDQQLEGFSYFLPVSSLAVYGGSDGSLFQQQRHALKSGADIVIATPGRLIAHLSMGYVDLSKVSFFILDEADRMLDMGFYDDIMQIAKHLPEERQTVMFSATMPPKIRKLAENILHNPVEVKIAVSKPAEKIRQHAEFISDRQKTPRLREILADRPDLKRVLVFASSKLKVKELARELRRAHYNVEEMHSDLEQARRDEVMHSFRNGSVNLLIATDIVSRGIDIDDIQLVVNYDVPREAEDYVHRIGRTARADNDGEAMTFISEKDQRRWQRIERLIGKRFPRKTDKAGGEAETVHAEESGNKKPKRRQGNHHRNNKSLRAAENQPQNAEASASQQGESSVPTAEKKEEESPKKNRRRHYRRRSSAKKSASEAGSVAQKQESAENM